MFVFVGGDVVSLAVEHDFKVDEITRRRRGRGRRRRREECASGARRRSLQENRRGVAREHDDEMVLYILLGKMLKEGKPKRKLELFV